MKNVYAGDKFEFNIDGAKHVLSIYQDNDSVSPREYHHRNHMYCFHSNYKLGDAHCYDNIEDAIVDAIDASSLKGSKATKLKSILNDESRSRKDRHKLIIDKLNMSGDMVIKYLYLYDHSGITISTSDFNDPWDSGIVGIIYTTKQEILNESVIADEVSWSKVASDLIEEDVELYDQWLTGDVYGFELKKLNECPCCKAISEEEIDCMGSFYGTDILTNGMLEYLPQEIVDYFEEENKNA